MKITKIRKVSGDPQDYCDAKTITENFFIKTNKNCVLVHNSPALMIWSDFPGVEGPGVGFKTLPAQISKGVPKDFFTDASQIAPFMQAKAEANGMDLTHRQASFEEALLKLSASVKPGVMLQGDVLWANESEVQRDGDSVTCKPNTITYTFYKKDFPNIDKPFGICIHTMIDSNLGKNPVADASAYGNFSDAFILSPEDVKIQIDPSKTSIAEEKVNELESFLSNSSGFDGDINELRKGYKRAAKVAQGKEALISTMIADPKLVKAGINEQIISDYITGMVYASIANSAIVDMYHNPIGSKINDQETEGEGYVIDTPAGFFKFVKDEFTQSNVEHIHSIHESVEKDVTKAYSSSKMSDLLKHYYGFSLEYGNGGGSNFGFATYLTTELATSKDAKVGWSDEVRKKLYGENVFEFEIPNKKLFFLDFENYKIVNPEASEDNYIEEQLNALGIELSPGQITSLYPEVAGNTAKCATRFFRYMSRVYYQGKKGNLRTPIDGFVYTGKQDGKVLVVWNSYSLQPVAVSNDMGQTWSECDKNSPEYQEYLKKSSSYNPMGNQEGRRSKIFDGNPTPEKERVYRQLMAYNSNDAEVNGGSESFMIAEGIFNDIVIHDNKTIDAKFKYNLAQNDSYIHFFRLRANMFLDKIFEMGYRFNNLSCDGLKVGGDSDKDWHIGDVPEEYYPMNLGNYKYLKLVNHSGSEVCDALEKIGPNATSLETLVLRACEVTEEVLEVAKSINLNIVYESTKKKTCVDGEGNPIEPTN